MHEGNVKLACQEHMIPGDTIVAKWKTIASLGYSGIELRGGGDAEFRARLPELKQAAKQGAVFPSICGILPVFVGDFDAGNRRNAIERVKVLLSGAAELGAMGVVTPAAYGIHSNALPPFKAPRSEAEDRAVLIDSFGELAEHAQREGVKVLVEPLNRYEDHMLNRLEQAVALCDAIGLESLAVMADLFHMGIEESNSAAALRATGRRLGHIHGADSNRCQPGAGQTDFGAIKSVLREVNYGGFIALECRLTGDPAEALAQAARVLS
jgi:sugar phosphate isomerase/epimerase